MMMSDNHTAAAVGLCQTPEMLSRIANLTASYADKGEELTMVSAPVVMLLLIVLFLGGVFNVSAVLGPSYRLLLSSALALSLPVMSYLFSEAKDAAGSGDESDLSVRARVILTWMLAAELLRKKVDEIRSQELSYSSTIQRAGRVVWLGSLVYFNITSAGRKAVFSILWILCATKLVQRVVFTEVEKRSYPDKSWLISSYMAQILSVQQPRQHRELNGTFAEHHRDSELEEAELPADLLIYSNSTEDNNPLKRCKYIVMGEEKLVGKVTADGYELKTDADSLSSIVTVGRVWEDLDPAERIIRRVCLSFSLFKLLRRRFEHLPEATEEEARDCRRLLTKGVAAGINNDMSDQEITKGAEVLFQVMADEVKFLSEYYHSVVPVVLASPLFVLVNYLLLPALVLCLCLVALLICGNGDMGYVLGRIGADNYALQPGLLRLLRCTLAEAAAHRRRPAAAFFLLDLSITVLLFIIFFLEEIWELLVVLISNWFLISVLHSYYATKPTRQRRSTYGTLLFRLILWLRRKMVKYTNISRLKQFSLLDHRRAPLMSLFMPAATLSSKLRSVPAPSSLKQAIVHYLVDVEERSRYEYRVPPPLATSRHSLGTHYDIISHLDLSPWLMGESVTEFILTWHIATCLLELTTTTLRSAATASSKVAMSLSRYCAYLVVFHPELLPDRRAKAELVVKDASNELRAMLGFWGYNFSLPRARARKLLRCLDQQQERNAGVGGVVLNGVKLGEKLIAMVRHLDEAHCWKALADVWTELIVYAAPSSDEEHVKGHADMLGEGVELITVLWAFAMHSGMSRSRPPNPKQSKEEY